MCGRYSLNATPEQIALAFGVPAPAEAPPRFNIAPTQAVLSVRQGSDSRELAALRWGLVPSWAKDLKLGASLINARAETLFSKPAFRVAARRRRCLLPASGFHEWRAAVASGAKQPFHVRLKGGALFAMGGVWERWTSPEGSVVESCSIVTTPANELMSPIHERMPLLLAPEDWAAWLDPGAQSPESVEPLLRPFPSERMEAYAISLRVNNARYDAADLLEAV